jgi:hypothetical protein
MAIIGQGVQAGLGRIDYSPYLQGAAAGAQGIAQGVAQFGQSVSIGIQNYLKKEQDKKLTAEGVAFIKSQFPGIDDKAAEAGLKFYGGPAAYAKVRNDQMVFEMQKKESELRLGELQRTIAERNKLEQFLTQTPAEAAIGAGTSFENLPTGAAAFLPRQYGNAQELLMAGQRAGIPVSQLIPVATGMASLGKTEAEAAALRVGKPVQGFGTGAEAFAEAKKMLKDAPGMQASFSTAGGRYFPELVKAPQPAFEDAEARLSAERASKQMDTFEKGITDAFSAADSASLVINALDKGETTGMFAPLSSFVSRALNLNDASQKTLLEKGVAGLSAQQVASLARGLGSMSNADREFFTATAPKLTDPTKATRFYAEMALENAKFAREDQDYIAMREAEGIGTKQILRELNKRSAGRNVAQSVYARVIGGLSPNAAQFAN